MKLAGRVTSVAAELLRRKKYVAPVEVFAGLGWLSARTQQAWEHGRVERLDQALSVPPDRLTAAVEVLSRWAAEQGLISSTVDYVSATRDRRALRFTGGDDKPFRTVWTDPTAKAARGPKVPDLVVLVPDRKWRCALCDGTGDLHVTEGEHLLCLDCADLGHLVLLPSGNTALTRRAHKASGLAAVVMRWNKPRKRFDRCGTLVEEAALRAAEEQCLADEDIRERRRERDRVRRAVEDLDFQAAFAIRIAELFPGLPTDRARAIAEHAGTRSSGRVGRSAAGRALDESAVTLAVVAAIRHEETPYDSLLMSGVARSEARERIRPQVEQVLARWRLT